MTSTSSHTAVMKVCWLASGEALTLLNPNGFTGKPILELKRFLKKMIGAPSFRQRLFVEDNFVEMKDDDILDSAVQTVQLIVSNVSLQDIVRFSVTPLPVACWSHPRENETVQAAYGLSYEIVLTLQSGHIHRDIATYRSDDSLCSCFALQEWPLILKMSPNVTESERKFSQWTKCHTACPDHVPFCIGNVRVELFGQDPAPMTLSTVLLMEDAGEPLWSRCWTVDSETPYYFECPVVMKRWLCEIVAMTEEVHRRRLLWHVRFEPERIFWNH